MITQNMVPQLVGRQAYDRDGKKIGEIGQVYLDDRNDTPMWATVNTGLLGIKESFVPLSDANLSGGELTLTVSKDEIKDAPRVADSGDYLSPEQASRLNRHYGRSADGSIGRNRSAGDAGHGMTRSEERLQVGTESVETGQVRLRKYVVTEDQQVTVPVSHEEVRIERGPVAPGERSGRSTIGEEQQQVTLHAERPVIGKRTEAVETARLATDSVTEEETVSGTVRKEKFDVEDPQNRLRR